MRSTRSPIELFNRQKVTVVGTAFTIRKLDTVDLHADREKEGKVALKNYGR